MLASHPDETFNRIRGHQEIVLDTFYGGTSYETDEEEATLLQKLTVEAALEPL